MENAMTYKQAIKILSETKVADLPYKGCGSNHKAYDIARRMAIQALQEKAKAEAKVAEAEYDWPAPKCCLGDTLYVVAFDIPAGIEVTRCAEVEKFTLNGVDTNRYVAPCVYNRKGNPEWTFYDHDFGVTVFTSATEAENVRNKQMLDNKDVIPCQEGDMIPFVVRTNRVIYYRVEKIKIREDGSVKIRCCHAGGGQNRSFTCEEVRTLLKSGGRLV